MITEEIKEKIERIVNVFETGATEGKYGALVKLKDYNDPETKTRIVQITFGRSQTTEFGNLKALIGKYIAAGGAHAATLSPYANRIGKKPSLSTDKLFCDTLQLAGRTDPVMRKCQDDFFDSFYYLPAIGWFKQMGFTLPLSLLVIYDSHIHSGSILGFLRERFAESPPVKGGDEKTWIAQYVRARHHWLETHSNQILRNTVYRTQCFKDQIKANNWDLEQPVKAHGVTVA
ncbi:chitosanase [Mucilaginibacter sp. JRF]|uniref:chitosanase n=1 Tax=Mucilaginibacter sp. JRF TaxID=2780088 RepID=UPI001881548B|nr:chitosanase [Mucilaginibacter sp. JRF]MBE9586595.1 chitosanase [Mucilaginibacter sp. JRF]